MIVVLPGKPTTVPCSFFQAEHAVEVEAVGVLDAAAGIGHRDDRRALVGHEPRRDVAGVAEALDDGRRLGEIHAEMLGGVHDREHAATSRGLVAALGSAETDRLAGHDARDRVADVHGVRVHEPGHDLGRGVDVRRRDVALGPDQDRDLGEEPAAESLELPLGQLLGVDGDAALAAAVRDAHDRALPGHPHREGLDLVERDVLVVPDAALGGAAAEVVLDAIAGEDLDGSVVHVHREVDRELAARLAQHVAQARVKVEHLGREIELVLGDLPGVDRLGCLLRRHGTEDPRWWGGGAVPERWVVIRTTPRGRSRGPAMARPGPRRTPPSISEYSHGAALPTGRSSPCRNQSVTSPSPVEWQGSRSPTRGPSCTRAAHRRCDQAS